MFNCTHATTVPFLMPSFRSISKKHLQRVSQNIPGILKHINRIPMKPEKATSMEAQLKPLKFMMMPTSNINILVRLIESEKIHI